MCCVRTFLTYREQSNTDINLPESNRKQVPPEVPEPPKMYNTMHSRRQPVFGLILNLSQKDEKASPAGSRTRAGSVQIKLLE